MLYRSCRRSTRLHEPAGPCARRGSDPPVRRTASGCSSALAHATHERKRDGNDDTNYMTLVFFVQPVFEVSQTMSNLFSSLPDAIPFCARVCGLYSAADIPP